MLAALPGQDDSVWMQPLRIAWLPTSHTGGTRSLQDLFYGRITEPGKIRRRVIAKYWPGRLAYVIGNGAYLHELRERQADAIVDEDDLSEFVANQALIALERSERLVRGARYKVPRILKSNVFANTDFQNLIKNAAQQGGTARCRTSLSKLHGICGKWRRPRLRSHST